MSKRERAATPALRALSDAGVEHTVRGYAHDAGAMAAAGGYGAEAALALDVAPERVLKTIVVSVDGALGVVIVPVGARIDLKAAATALGGRKATLADPADAQRATGYVVGGISPLGQRRALPTVVDASATAHATVLVSAGQRGLDVELSPADLVTMTSAVLADVGRPRA